MWCILLDIGSISKKELIKLSKKIIYALATVLFTFMNVNPSFATEVNEKQYSEVNINVNNPFVSLEQVDSPSFETLYLLNDKREYVSNKDLIIKIRDDRTDITSSSDSIVVRYEISEFHHSFDLDKSLMGKTHLSLGLGNIDTLPPTDYESKKTKLYSQDSQDIIKIMNSKPGVHTITIPKEEIYFSLDENSMSGSYEFEQTITLLLVPTM